MISELITLPYKAARLPLDLADKALADRLPDTSAPRVALDRALGSADKLAGGVLRNPALARRGSERLEKSSKLVTAERLTEEADARREAARETATTGKEKAAAKRKAAEKRAESGLQEAATVEARGKQEARSEAARTAAELKAAADRRAQAKKGTVEQRKAAVESVATAKKKSAQRQAKNELADARSKKQSAAEARADADRLEELTEAKKQSRKKR